MSQRPTIADVAAKAGVSMMTVSRAINNKEGVSEATRERILEIAQEMGFHPNSIARGMVTKRTTTIGLVVPDIANPFFAEIARGVEDVAYEHDYNVFLLNSSERVTREKKALDSLWSKQVDGLIWCSSRLEQSKLLHYLERFSHVVLVNREIEHVLPGVVTINMDDMSSAHQAVAYLVQQGRQQLAFVAGPEFSFSIQRLRQGFQAACEAYDVIVDESSIQYCDPSSEGGYQTALTLLRQQPNIDAIWAVNDLVAVGVLQACRETGHSVPQDIAVIGTDNIPLATLVTPSLSTLRTDKYGLGEQAMNTLLQLMSMKDEAVLPNQTIQAELILRDSTPN
jgi:LacI family transcriptional regulator